MRHALILVLESLGLKDSVTRAINSLKQRGIECITARVEAQLPHDQGESTQGLVYHDGILHENTGLEDASSLRCLNSVSGQILRKIPLKNVWAERITIINNQLVQLTWKNNIALVYRLPGL